MVSIVQTSRKYRGRKAETYDAVRGKQARWKIENETVSRMLGELRPRSVVDCPVGTGRFLETYATLGVASVSGYDISNEMLVLARDKNKKLHKKYPNTLIGLYQGSALEIDQTVSADVAVCVRFLDLIEEKAMRVVVTELCRIACRGIVLTIRLGSEYVPKVNTSTHDKKRFRLLVTRLGWEISESVPVLNAGWEIIRLERRK